ncbi:tail fiber domain-containing protein [Tahibacter amnicola]|uniref:Tail fiber domain-containing protein n=1 Tax=Tahibacter amnicola TaxID=2976241 RepID=A0ABY6BAA8_9GAMM|nr:tail fiber domain-containing protein [Tahibacter amnicola]UXI66998.1 tail fiber domain-containing protein [Tahibacter amnicola]
MNLFTYVPRPLALALGIAISATCLTATAAQTIYDPDGIRFLPAMAAPAYQLRVTGPGGFRYEQVFAGGETIRAQPVASGWADGQYLYELFPFPGAPARVRENGSTSANESMSPESGGFIVHGGTVLADVPIAGTSNREHSARDQVIADDLIVQGRVCAGQNCTNGEPFGASTLLLKADDTRITFDDTSTAPGAAANDWQLSANESTNPGLSKFYLEDLTGATIPFSVMSGAPTNSLFISAAGDIGVRTSTPFLDLHLFSTESPGVRLEQVSGFGNQTWDMAGNEANFFVRDVTGGNRLPFRIRPGAGTSSLDISGSGYVGLNTAAPSARLHVDSSDGTSQVKVTDTSASTGPRDLLRLENNGPTRLRMRNTATGSEWSFNAHDTDLRITPAGAAVVALTLQPGGNLIIAGTLTQLSDRNAKENFRPLDHKALLAKIAELPISEWNFKHEGKTVRHVGPMAQDFRAAFGLGDDDTHIAPLDTSGIALAAVQGLQQELAARDRALAERDRRIADLEAQVARIERITQQLVRLQEPADTHEQHAVVAPSVTAGLAGRTP